MSPRRQCHDSCAAAAIAASGMVRIGACAAVLCGLTLGLFVGGCRSREVRADVSASGTGAARAEPSDVVVDAGVDARAATSHAAPPVESSAREGAPPLGAPMQATEERASAVRVVRVDPSPDRTPAAGGVGVVATLAEAVELVAQARIEGSTASWTIRLTAGEHLLARSVAIGRALGPLTIEADGPGATIVGALDIPRDAWREPDAAILERLPAEARAHARVATFDRSALDAWAGGLSGPVHSGHAVDVAAIGSELFVGSRALEPASWPNDGFASIGAILDRGSAPREAEPDMPAHERRVEAPRAGAFVPADRDRVSRWVGAEDAWAHGFWNWDWSDEVLPIASVDAAEGAVRLGMPHRYGLAARGRFRVINMLGELDEPGECWIDRGSGRIVAWIPEPLRGARASISLLAEPFLRIEGAADVRIVGIRFERTRGGAIDAKDVARLSIESCHFVNLGTHGIDAQGSSIHIADCRFEDLGGRGVRLRGGERRTLTPSGSSIESCTFLGCGRVLRSYNPAIDLEGVGHRILRNEIARHPHIAIFMRGNDHLIEANDIHDVVLETGDAGAVYCGRDWTTHGNVIRGNAFSAIHGSDARFQNAVYLDDMASGFLVERNLFVDCNWGILAGGGRDNTIRVNIFARCGRAISYDARGVGWMAPHIADPASSTLHRNLAAMPIDEEPWRTRFPTLRTYLTDRFGRPVGSSIDRSVLLGSPFGRVDDPAGVQVEGTVTIEAGDAEALASECVRLLGAARAGTLEFAGVELGPVGPAIGLPRQ